jgi:transposase
MNPDEYFLRPKTVAQKQYEVLRMFFIEGAPAKSVAKKFGYTYRTVTSLIDDFRKNLSDKNVDDLFFAERHKGRKASVSNNEVKSIIVEMRKNFYSVENIKVLLDGKGYSISEKSIFLILRREGFGRLPRRSKLIKNQLVEIKMAADKSEKLSFDPESFKSASAGILCLIPYLNRYGLDKIIEQSDFPQTKTLDRVNSILSFLALKLSNIRRYSADNLWCMDRGSGLFAGLNVLPKTAWFTSYSDRVTSDMNLKFLRRLHQTWVNEGLLSDTINLDFTTIPYWGDDAHLENNWSGKRGKALSSMLAILANDPDSGIIDYGNTNVLHKDESKVVLEFLDFYRYENYEHQHDLKYLVFDSKFTNYENLSKLDDKNTKFITIRRRGKNMVDKIDRMPKNNWKTVRVECAGNKNRTLKVMDYTVFLKGYNKNIRQICITGHGKIKPAIILTNDFELKLEKIIRKYSKRWLIEKGISEQIEFFHLNRVSSSMVIKVDFDLTMSILANNIYRLFALDLDRYAHSSVQTLFEKFILNTADINIEQEQIIINLKKKRNLPLVLETMCQFSNIKYRCFKNKKLIFQGASYS